MDFSRLAKGSFSLREKIDFGGMKMERRNKYDSFIFLDVCNLAVSQISSGQKKKIKRGQQVFFQILSDQSKQKSNRSNK